MPLKTHRFCKQFKCKHLHKEKLGETVAFYCTLHGFNIFDCRARLLGVLYEVDNEEKENFYLPPPDDCPYILEHTLLRDRTDKDESNNASTA